MAARVTITDPDGKTRWFSLEEGDSLTVGRGTECDIIVLDRLVSRRHCVIAATSSGYAVRDFESINGTFYNGRRIDVAELTDGALVQVGNTRIALSLPWVGRGTATTRPRPARFLQRAAMLILGAGIMAAAGYGGLHLADFARKQAIAGDARPLNVTSEPPRAMVLVDDRYVGLTPLSDVFISPGPHSIRLQKADHQDWTHPVAQGDGSVAVKATLLSTVSGIFVVESAPPGAEVYIDGRRVGVTPLHLTSVSIGQRDVRVQKTNYISHFEKIFIEPSKEVSLKCRLKIRAAETYIALIKTDPNNCSYHCELAHVYLLERKIELAGKYLESALDVYARGDASSEHARRLKWLFDKIYANNYFHWSKDEGQLDKMRDEVDRVFLTVMARHPDNDDLCDWLTSVHSEAGRPFNAEVLRKFLKLQPEKGIKACVATATRLARLGKTQQAADILEMATKAAPENFDIFYTLGKIHYRNAVKGNTGAISRAVLSLTKARSLCDDNSAKQHQIDAYLMRLQKLTR